MKRTSYQGFLKLFFVGMAFLTFISCKKDDLQNELRNQKDEEKDQKNFTTLLKIEGLLENLKALVLILKL